MLSVVRIFVAALVQVEYLLLSGVSRFYTDKMSQRRSSADTTSRDDERSTNPSHQTSAGLSPYETKLGKIQAQDRLRDTTSSTARRSSTSTDQPVSKVDIPSPSGEVRKREVVVGALSSLLNTYGSQYSGLAASRLQKGTSSSGQEQTQMASNQTRPGQGMAARDETQIYPKPRKNRVHGEYSIPSQSSTGTNVKSVSPTLALSRSQSSDQAIHPRGATPSNPFLDEAMLTESPERKLSDESSDEERASRRISERERRSSTASAKNPFVDPGDGFDSDDPFAD